MNLLFSLNSFVCFALDSLVDKQCGLSIASVTDTESATGLNNLIVEVVSHLGFRITVNEPHQINIVILRAIGDVLFSSKESVN